MAKSAGRPLWGELLWSERLNQPLVNIRTPLWREGSFVGILLTAVTVAELSTFLVDPPTTTRRRHLHPPRPRARPRPRGARAHSLAVQAGPPASRRSPRSGIPILASIWGTRRDIGTAAAVVGPSGGHAVDVGGVPYVFLYRELAGYSDRPWLIGRYMPLEELRGEVRRLERATWIGLAAVLAAVAGAWLMGYAVGRPILRLARATAAIRDLDLGSARPLGGSRLRELDEAIGAYNALVATFALVRDVRPAGPGEAPDGAGRQGAGSRGAHGHGAVHRHRRFHGLRGAAVRSGDGGIPQRALPPPGRLRGSRRQAPSTSSSATR